MLSRQAVLGAAQSVYSLVEAQHREEAGESFSGQDLENVIVPQSPEVLYQPFMELLAKIEKNWQVSISVVLEAMGVLGTSQEEDVLYCLVMGCLGHGVSLSDDYQQQFNKAQIQLGRELDYVLLDMPVEYEDAAVKRFGNPYYEVKIKSGHVYSGYDLAKAEYFFDFYKDKQPVMLLIDNEIQEKSNGK